MTDEQRAEAEMILEVFLEKWPEARVSVVVNPLLPTELDCIPDDPNHFRYQVTVLKPKSGSKAALGIQLVHDGQPLDGKRAALRRFLLDHPEWVAFELVN